MKNDFLNGTKKQFEYYKMLGEKTFDQLSEEQLFWQDNEECNNIAMIVNHLHGNMLSRWTDFLNTDGEKTWRNREEEFSNSNSIGTRAELMEKWQAGWACLFAAIDPLTEADLNREIYIRNQGHSVSEAILRQLAHYPYHIGQIVHIGKMICGTNWISLSIARGDSNAYNAEKFAQPKARQHFTDEYIKKP